MVRWPAKANKLRQRLQYLGLRVEETPSGSVGGGTKAEQRIWGLIFLGMGIGVGVFGISPSIYLRCPPSCANTHSGLWWGRKGWPISLRHGGNALTHNITFSLWFLITPFLSLQRSRLLQNCYQKKCPHLCLPLSHLSHHLPTPSVLTLLFPIRP